MSQFFDLHNDAILKVIYDNGDIAGGSSAMHVDIPKARSSGLVKGLFFAIWCDPVFEGEDGVKQTLHMLDTLKGAFSKCERDVKVILKSCDVEEAEKKNKIAALIAVEGGHSINNDIANLKKLFDGGVRSMTLTHVNSVDWAGSMSGPAQNGLNGFGEQVIGEMNRLGMIVDVAHVSEKTLFDVVRVTKKPVICSHTSARGCYNSPRGLSDGAIKAVAGTGGVVGVIFFPEFLEHNPHADSSFLSEFIKAVAGIRGEQGLSLMERSQKIFDLYKDGFKLPPEYASAEAIFRHVDYMVNLVGEEHVALGSDYDGIPYACKGVEDISKIGELFRIFESHGYAPSRIEKVMGANAARVIKECFSH